MQMIVGFTLAVLISWLAYRFRALDGSGFAAAVLLGGIVFSAGGLTWSVPLLVFFFSSSLWTRISARKTPRPPSREGKRGRSAQQVLANGGVALLSAASLWIHPQADWQWWCYLGSLAAVTADTWATEIGPLLSGTTILITTGKRVPPGTSGGVSIPGTLASAAGAAILAALVSLPAAVTFQPLAFVFVLAAGLTGSLIDSLLGATVQRQARCPACGKITDQPQDHPCQISPDPFRGIPWITNDSVNLICAAAGGTLALLLHSLWLS